MEGLLENIRNVVGESGLLLGADVTARSDSWPPLGGCQAKAIVRPCSTNEVSAVLKLCHQHGQSVVTHGGLTGLAGGALTSGDDLVISLERMRRLEPVDAINRTVLVEAGVPLQAVHEAVTAAGLLFPLDLGARGSCTIGGNLSTNAGGNSVIRYGMAREQVLGVEAVLADGTIISSLSSVIKNNTGYDLKQLFIGSEGTLGIITRAVLRLRPVPRSRQTALVAIADFTRLARFLPMMDAALGGTLSAFEVMWNDFYSLIVAGGKAHGLPLDASHPFYVLIESSGGQEDIDRARFERALEQAFEEQLIVDAAVAQSRQQRADLWAIRDDIDNLFAAMDPLITFDVSLGIAHMDEYVRTVRARLLQQWPHGRMVVFGHIGDGNIHIVISVGSDDAQVVHAVDEVVYSTLKPYRGVISAEHGIGVFKREFLSISRSDSEINLMRTLKLALDPKGILNPGKIFAAAG
ncbi:MAG: FAD-binding oxidoreductase [Xanthomonadales bacterium]|nr:FAD-binding oxidoreductase [Xanthomonadales bacterium]